MATVDIKGMILSNEYRDYCDFYGIECFTPSKLKDALDSEDDDITLNIASGGGDVFAASEIYTALKSCAKNVTANIVSIAASAASVIAMSADTINMSPTSQIMIHKASSSNYGNSDSMIQEGNVLNSIDRSIALAYEMKTGMSEDDIINLMAEETWMSAKDALDKGFADNIMFAEVAQVANAMDNLPSLNEVRAFNSKIKQTQEPSLRDRKLAILLEK